MRRLRHCALAALAMLAACASQPPVPPEPAASGRVSGELILDPGTLVAEPEPDEVHEPPMQRAGNLSPVYPAELIAARLPPQSVSVRIVVDREGRVARVDPLEGAGTPDARFLAAVREAVMRWRFEPFRVIEWADGPDADGNGEPDGQQVVGEQTRPFRFDMRFRFEVVDGVARVSS
ncbi:MAG: hypothetical protein IPK27_14495 [Rhodanobacteraceae bacterium]|nr:hypothetical protein [Rhodanobacteraceae bacterium]